MRPPAPLIAMRIAMIGSRNQCRHTLAIELNGFDDLFSSFGTATARLANAARFTPRAEHLVELFLIRGVIGHGGVGVFELMAGEHAHDSLVGPDYAFGDQQFRAGHAGRTRRFTAEAAGAHLALASNIS